MATTKFTPGTRVIVTVDDDVTPAEYQGPGEIREYDGQSVVVDLDSGHSTDVLPEFVELEEPEEEEKKGTELVNLTPHPITIVDGDGSLTLPPATSAARREETVVQDDPIVVNGHKVPVTRREYGALTGLPEPREGVVYIVSALVAQAAPERQDLVVPGPAVRDADGNVIGCRGLSRVGAGERADGEGLLAQPIEIAERTMRTAPEHCAVVDARATVWLYHGNGPDGPLWRAVGGGAQPMTLEQIKAERGHAIPVSPQFLWAQEWRVAAQRLVETEIRYWGEEEEHPAWVAPISRALMAAREQDQALTQS